VPSTVWTSTRPRGTGREPRKPPQRLPASLRSPRGCSLCRTFERVDDDEHERDAGHDDTRDEEGTPRSGGPARDNHGPGEHRLSENAPPRLLRGQDAEEERCDQQREHGGLAVTREKAGDERQPTTRQVHRGEAARRYGASPERRAGVGGRVRARSDGGADAVPRRLASGQLDAAHGRDLRGLREPQLQSGKPGSCGRLCRGSRTAYGRAVERPSR
jgi:hypothetical protein